MTHQQKILGSIGIVFLLIAIFISFSSDKDLYGPGSMMSRSFNSSIAPVDSYGGMMADSEIAVTTSAAPAMMKDSGMMPSLSVQNSGTEFGQKIIKNGSLTLTVSSIDTAAEKISSLAKQYGGDVTNRTISQESRSSARQAGMTVRVSADSFDAAMADMKKLATEVTYENTSANDVTSEYVDLTARLENAHAEEASYVAVLAKATNVEDILKVQDYLSQVRGDIESMEAQQKYLDSQTGYSTIEISLSEETQVTLSGHTFRPGQAAKDAVQTVIDGAQGFVIGLIKFLIVGGAILLPLAIFFWIGRAVWRRFHK